MPKVKTESSSSSVAQAKLQFFTIKYQKRTILAALDLTRKHFKTLAGKEIYFETRQADIAAGQAVELTDDVWEGVIGSLTAVEAFERKEGIEVRAETNVVAWPAAAFGNAPAAPLNWPLSPPTQPERRTITLNLVSFIDGAENFSVKTKTTTSWDKIASVFCSKNRRSISNLCETEIRMTLDGSRPHGKNIGDDIDGLDGPYEVYFTRPQLGGKPVIYIWTPQPQDVSVDLSLTSHWSFSSVYPVAPITLSKLAGGTGQSLTWNVLTREDGNLQDKATGLEVNSLFWEAETNSHIDNILDSPPSSRPSSPAPGVDAFNPIKATLADHDSVLLRVSDMTPYLDASLRALGLHTEARTSFITYVLAAVLPAARSSPHMNGTGGDIAMPMQALSEEERMMTVEQWIRHEIDVQYERLRKEGETKIRLFRERAEEVRRRIEAL
ncbi:hypothetical protein EWM64_g1520 [Hericium alpestre]|uniref:Uncharacterized protein n=1 Tax=Hericium alpestre TaxID=135208 RepID=A0A4Z0AAC9_9AGAM|nr:hypothetical protein EWM64_g1520 [Hericium alpestre]